MRALVCSRLDGVDALEVGELPEPPLIPRTARVAIEASGVNFPDLLMTRGLYQDQPALPFAPGMEMAGTVTEVAADVEAPAVGDRVFGYLPYGAFASQCVVSADALFPVPDGMSFEVAAALPIAYGTSYHALMDRGRLQPDESLLVLGAAGGVGLAAVQIGASMGARVVAAVSSPEKAAAAEAAGAATVIRYDRSDLRDELKALPGGGIDVVFDPVGGSATEAAFRSLAWQGRHLVIGFAGGDIPSLAANLPLLKGSSLVGVFWSRFTASEPEANRDNFALLGRWWTEGRIHPVVSETFPLDSAKEALEKVGGRRAIGKLVVLP